MARIIRSSDPTAVNAVERVLAIDPALRKLPGPFAPEAFAYENPAVGVSEYCGDVESETLWGWDGHEGGGCGGG